MGWKAVKDHYRIEHIVQMTEKGLCIGSAYIHDIIVVSRDGVLIKRYDRSSGELGRYQSEMEANPQLLAELIAAPDHFSRSVPVYTYDGGTIVEKFCEKLDWPNVTHDGQMMYENTYSADKKQVVKWAKSNARSGVKLVKNRITELQTSLAELEQRLAEYHRDTARLEADYPEPGTTKLPPDDVPDDVFTTECGC
jgi:hypothetical protein